MRFKYWFYINEAISEKDKNDVLNSKLYTNEKDLNVKSKLDQLLSDLESDEKTYSKGEIFKKIGEIIPTIGIKKEKPKEEDPQRKHFANMEGTTEEELLTYDYYKNENKEAINEMMNLLRRFVGGNIIQLKIENNKPEIYFQNEKLNSPDFTRFMSALHNIEGEIEEYKGSGNTANPVELWLRQTLDQDEHKVAKGDKVWVFKGNRPNVCRLLGKGQKWCISSTSSASHWFSYRVNHKQTQYFVFDFNKPENDPARYVNPGVAPEGGYSEWVDARNNHSRDPNDSHSEVGINGYNSIKEYKDYLESKGIPKSTWKALPLEDWEERLGGYYNRNDFDGAKNDDDPRVFDIYLKIANNLKDENFDTLTDEQKKEFILGRQVADITDKQFDYMLANHKKEYYDSLNFTQKLYFAVRIDDENLLHRLAKMPDLSDEDVSYLLTHAINKDEMTKIIISHKKELTNSNVFYLLHYAINKNEMATTLGTENISKLDNSNVSYLLDFSKNKDEMANIIITHKKELSDDNVSSLLKYAINKDEMANIIITHKKELNYDNVEALFWAQEEQSEQDEIMKLLVTKNINKLTDNGMVALLDLSTNKDEMANIIINHNKELGNNTVRSLIDYAGNNVLTTNIYEMIKLIINHNKELTFDAINHFIFYVENTDEMIKFIITHKKELTDQDIKNLIYISKNTDEIIKFVITHEKKLTDENLSYYLFSAENKDEIIKFIITDKKELTDDNIDCFLSYAENKDEIKRLLREKGIEI